MKVARQTEEIVPRANAQAWRMNLQMIEDGPIGWAHLSDSNLSL